MRGFLVLIALSAGVAFSPLSLATNQKQETFITVTACDYSAEEIFNLMAAAEQKVLFTTQQNWEKACAQQHQMISEQSSLPTTPENNQ